MPQPKMQHQFSIINHNLDNAQWTGAPTSLAQHASLNLPETPAGSLIVTLLNQATQNNQGQVSLTSGGAQPEFITVPALANAPVVKVNNWNANNLGVTNVSPATATPILVAAVGPGLPGLTPGSLPSNGTKTSLLPYGATGVTAVSGNALAQWMQLSLQASNSGLTIFGIIGGPLDSQQNNAYVIQVNASANTGPGSGSSTPAPAGYYATVTANSYGFNFNWGSSSVFVVNLSPATTQNATVAMFSL